MLAGRTIVLGTVAIPIAMLRFFMQGWLEPHGIAPGVGSHFASLWVLLLIALFLLFGGAGRRMEIGYWNAARWFFALAAWCEILVILGILMSDKLGRETYFQGPWESVKHNFPTAREHAIGHVQGFWFRLVFELILGFLVFKVARRFCSKCHPAATTPP